MDSTAPLAANAALSPSTAGKGIQRISSSSTSATVATTVALSVSSSTTSGAYPALITPKLMQQSMKEKKQHFHLTMEKALGWGKNKKKSSTTASTAASFEPVQLPVSIEQHKVTDHHHQQHLVFKKHKLTTLSSLVNSLRVTSFIPHRFMSMEEEINNDVSSTSSIDPKCFSLLQQFYDELMVSTFPLDEEREDINDWMQCFRMQMHARQSQEQRQRLAARTMLLDVILMIQDNCDEGKIKILGGAAINYYNHSRVGLLSYVVLHDEYRGCGLSKLLHEEALARMEMLASKYSGDGAGDGASKSSSRPLRAIFAETNTPAAGDITPTQCLIRHKSLYSLGYRLVKFPYSQPPLSKEDGVNASFHEIVLLVYLPLSNDELARMDHYKKDDSSNFDPMRSKRELMMRYCSWFFDEEINDRIIDDCILSSNTVKMNVNIPLGYIEDFYQNAFRFKNATCGEDDVGSDAREKSSSSGEETMIDYHTADYYKFARWFSFHCQQHQCVMSEGIVEVSLRRPSSTPWEDCKEFYLPKWKEWQKKEERRSTPQDLM